jgi:import inner membrane translocase subunit TIM8
MVNIHNHFLPKFCQCSFFSSSPFQRPAVDDRFTGQRRPAAVNVLEEEKRKAMFNEVVSKLADVCFDKCVSKPGSSLDRYETACLSQCALRYLETGQVIMGRIQRMQ